MKLLTVAIPSYNSEAYLSHAVETLLTGAEDIEIIIVNDGSKDATAEIADRYAKEYPNIIKAVHQENGGHGQAVNTGLAHATGLYYKVVDSDDWVDEKALKTILAEIKRQVEKETWIDMYIANYVYERVHEGKQRVVDYKGVLPENEIFGWKDIGHFSQSQFIIMHSVIYRTQLLRDCGLLLPKHTFYVDNIFVYNPLPYVKTMYYLNVDFYRYFIGREDQSVNEKVMMGRMDQQLRVTRQMIDQNSIGEIQEKKLKEYMVKYITIMMTICSVFLIKLGTEEDLKKNQEIWNYLKEQDPELYHLVGKSALGKAMKMHGPVGRGIIKAGYRVTRKLFGYN